MSRLSTDDLYLKVLSSELSPCPKTEKNNGGRWRKYTGVRSSDFGVYLCEGRFNLGPAPALFVRVWHPGFIDPGLATAF